MTFAGSKHEEVTISFFGGLNTIGGVHIVVGRGDTGIVFDLGLSVRNLFSESVRASSRAGARSFLLTRSAPPVLGLYRKDAVGDVSEDALARLWRRDSVPTYRNLHAFVSHIHQDHMALLPFVSENVPVYMHRDAHSVYRAVVASGEYADTKATIRPLDDLAIVELGDGLRLQIVEVDHDSPGCSGFLLHTGDGVIAFTADWRRHGYHPYRMDRFAQLAKAAGAELLITEGTTLRPDTLFRKEQKRLEADVAHVYQTTLEQARGLVYVNILARNVERVAELIEATRRAERLLVMDESTAALWHTATTQGIVALDGHPALASQQDVIRVLRSSSEPGSPESKVELPYATVELADIIRDKAAYAVYLTYKQLPLLAELEAIGEREHASYYVHADGNPLNDKDETLRQWLTLFSVHYVYCATGGHAASYEISDLVEAAAPKVVIPLHSNHPTLFDSRGIARYYPTLGETTTLSRLIGTPVPLA
ncbi:MBL fold metallo-hydrolase [Paenibacillus sp. TRM 82003]|nr:MBL fold metallo-hydrolase [Paenibacillus sp. TRM 82003]